MKSTPLAPTVKFQRLCEVPQGSNSLKSTTYFHDSLGMWTKVSMVEGGHKEEEVELGHGDAVKASDFNRDTTVSHGALGLMESDTCSVLSAWPGPRGFWERLWEAAFSSKSSVGPSFSLLWISILHPQGFAQSQGRQLPCLTPSSDSCRAKARQ